MEIDHMSPQLHVRAVQGRAHRPHSIHSTTGASRHIKKTALFSPDSAALQERTFISEFITIQPMVEKINAEKGIPRRRVVDINPASRPSRAAY